MGSIVEVLKTDKATGKTVKAYRAHIRRTGFKSQSKTFTNKTAAREWLRNNEAEVLLEKEGKGRGTTFSKLVDTFTASPPMRGTRYWEPSHLEFWIGQFGTMRLTEITHAEINAGLAELQTRQVTRASKMLGMEATPTEKTLTAATVNRYGASLRSVFNFAVKRGIMDAHPMKTGKVEKLEEGPGRSRILTDEEVQRLMDEAAKSRWPMMPLYLSILLTTAARKSEVLNLKWHQIDMARSIAVLPRTKNGKPRSLPLVSEVKEELEKARKVRPVGTDFVFYDPANPKKPKDVSSTWRAVRERAGLLNDRDDPLDRVVLHTTRHTGITTMLRGGANLAQAASVSGHQTLAMLKRYEHLAAQDAVELAERLLGKKTG